MAKVNVLDEFMNERERALGGPAARFVTSQGIKRSNGARVNVKALHEDEKPVEVKREEPSQMHYRPTGMQQPPDTNEARFVAPREAPRMNVLDAFYEEHQAKRDKEVGRTATLRRGMGMSL